MKPMLASACETKDIKFPVYASPKLDGLRGLIHNGILLSRSLKSIPNRHVSKILSNKLFEGLDGELILGPPTAPDVYRQSTSFFMSEDKVGDGWTFRVFDIHDCDAGYESRLEKLNKRGSHGVENIVLHEQRLIHNEDDLLSYEQSMLTEGYEGLILRAPHGKYKYGRSTAKEGLLLKLKRFEDSEAEIIGFEEQMFNGNEATVNELGRTKRSSHKAGKIGKNTLGALVVRDLTSGVEFNVGTGMDDALRKEIWNDRSKYSNHIIKYKYFPVGVKEAPRHPVFLGFRDKRDM